MSENISDKCESIDEGSREDERSYVWFEKEGSIVFPSEGSGVQVQEAENRLDTHTEKLGRLIDRKA